MYSKSAHKLSQSLLRLGNSGRLSDFVGIIDFNPLHILHSPD